MTKKKTLLLAVLSLVFVLCCAVFAGCGGTKYTVTWNVDEHATVAVEGETELPKEVKEGTELVFTVTPANGYEIDSVKNGTSNVTAKDGKYKITVKNDVTINVTVKRVIESIAVTTNPTKLTYNAGDALDKTGMVVTVKYKNGDTEPTTAYSVSPANFSAGDKAFTVSYGGVKSAEVALDATVQGVIVLDPIGGKIASEVMSALNARADFDSVDVADNGVITIKYTALTAEIVLPTADQVSKGLIEGEFKYVGWQTVVDKDETATSVSKIAADYKGSYNLALKWNANLLTINSLKFEHATVNGVEGPYLVINAAFNATDSVYLYLYEGNDKVELKGDTYEKDASKETQDLYFYLPTLGEYESGSYAGKWMDVCFNAVIDGVEYSQSFPLDHENPIAEVGPTIQDSVNSYTLLTYRSNNVDYIKLAFKPYTSTYGFKFDGDKMTVHGKINTESASFKDKGYAGGTATLSLGKSGDKSGAINADGTWAIDFTISEIGTVSAAVMPSISFADKDGAALTTFAPSYTAGLNAYPYDGGKFGNPSYYTAKHAGNDGLVVYVGNMGSNWQDAIFAVIDEGHEITKTNITLVAGEGGKPMVQISGTYGFAYTAAEAKAAIEETLLFSLQCYQTESEGQWGFRYYSSASTVTVTVNDDGTYKALFDITASADDIITEGKNNSEIKAGDIMYGHYPVGDFSKDGGNASTAHTEATITYNGLVFRIGPANEQCASWMSSLPVIYVTAA